MFCSSVLPDCLPVCGFEPLSGRCVVLVCHVPKKESGREIKSHGAVIPFGVVLKWFVAPHCESSSDVIIA